MPDTLSRGMAHYFAMGAIVDTVLLEVRHRPLLRERLAMGAIDRAHDLGHVIVTREVCRILKV